MISWREFALTAGTIPAAAVGAIRTGARAWREVD